MTAADDAVLAAVERDLLDEALVEGTLARVKDRLQPTAGARDTRRSAVEQQLRQVEQEMERLTDAIAAGAGDVGPVLTALKARDTRRQMLKDELVSFTRKRSSDLDEAKVEMVCRKRLADWRSLLRAHVSQARQILRKLLNGRIVFTPDAEQRPYRFSAPGTLTRLLGGFVDPVGLASLTGFDTRGTAFCLTRVLAA